ncbi:Protein C03B1.13 [Aphelenchoides avenae]|nr:Protein C03B1.13 [Aphelenchus avenae]
MVPHVRLIVIASLVSFCSNWQFGYQITYINTATETFYKLTNDAYRASANCANCSLQYDVWETDWSVVVSSIYPGTFLGFVLVRLFFTFILFLALGRLLVGIHAGCALCLLPLFIIEISARKYRPFLSSFQQLFQALATLIGLILGSSSIVPLGTCAFEWLQITAAIPTVMFVAILLYLPDTPYYVLDRRKPLERDCEKGTSTRNLKRILCIQISTKQEAFERWEFQSRTRTDECFRKENLMGVIIGSIAAVSFATTGDDIIDSYSAQILFVSTGGTKNEVELLSVLLGTLLFITSIGGVFLVDRFGRKRVLILGLLGTALSNGIAAIGSSVHSEALAIVGFALTKTFIGLGAGAPAWFLTSELVSSRLTSVCQSISTGLLLVAVGTVSLTFLPLGIVIGAYNFVALTSAPAFLAAVILFLFLPETKNKSYSQIRSNFRERIFPGLSWTNYGRKKHKSTKLLAHPETSFYGSLTKPSGRTSNSFESCCNHSNPVLMTKELGSVF